MRKLLFFIFVLMFIFSGCNQESDTEPYKPNTDPNKISGVYGQELENEIMFLWTLSNRYLKDAEKTYAYIEGYAQFRVGSMTEIFEEEMKVQYSDVFESNTVNKLLKYNDRFNNLNELLIHYFKDKKEVDSDELEQIKEMIDTVIYEISTLDNGGSHDMALYNLISNPYAFEDVTNEEVEKHLTSVDGSLYSLERFLSK